MRAPVSQDLGPVDLRRALGRLEALPMRPSSARQVLAGFLDDEPDAPSSAEAVPLPTSAANDPAWAVAISRFGGSTPDLLATVAVHCWWASEASECRAGEALTRLWRHSLAVAFAARRMARDAGDPDPESVGRAGLLHNLGLWALASLAPERLAEWFDAAGPSERRAFERRWLGEEASSLGRSLAARWRCEPLVVEAAWLHADLDADLEACSDQPGRLAWVQQAYATALTTPWAPGSELAREAGPIDPRVRILTAEVQARSGQPFVEPDANGREERLTRDNARLRLVHARLLAEQASNERFLRAFVDSSPDEGPEPWADRAGLAWCGEPGVSAARVVWTGPGALPEDRPASEGSSVLKLGDPTRPIALVQLREGPEGYDPGARPTFLAAWQAWAGQVAGRDRLRRQLDDVLATLRKRVEREEPTRRKQRIDALAEFAAGAGHELNNPLAVVLGRAQLLLTREDDPEAARSLRAIITQAQRAARILRDLMYVARPPEPRPRACQPEELVRACLRDLQSDAEARGVRLVAEAREPGPRVWADPEPLRQIADILTRNALESTPSGGVIQFTAHGDGRSVRWSIHDNGRGIGPAEGLHLFDPFYCGRSAGRGLGLGLPRAARIVALLGGELRWQSNPGVGTTFAVTIPVAEIPTKFDEEGPTGTRPGRPSPAP